MSIYKTDTINFPKIIKGELVLSLLKNACQTFKWPISMLPRKLIYTDNNGLSPNEKVYGYNVEIKTGRLMFFREIVSTGVILENGYNSLDLDSYSKHTSISPGNLKRLQEYVSEKLQ